MVGLGKLLCSSGSSSVASRSSAQDGSRRSQRKSGSRGGPDDLASLATSTRAVKHKSMLSMDTSISEVANNFENMIERTTAGIVVLKMLYPVAYDGGSRGASGATGFVVDKERGIILTNRHVVTGGPIQADATFINKEEVALEPIYADPVHDFGFFRFDPSKVKYLDLVEIPLAPERAKVGLEIRVVGNDAGEKLMILPGTLARLDRNAPLYQGGYCDFNTFYYSAASNTSGGSSGSPVLDLDGYAVALNAGGAFMAASSFYLPLDRVVRALEYVQRGEPVPRRTAQLVLTHKSFAEADRLGLPDKTQEDIRSGHPDATGLLVVRQVVEEGPAQKAGLEPGDILVKLNGQYIHEFVPFEEAEDASVKGKLRLTLRRGGTDLDVELRSDELTALMPTEFLQVSDGILHEMSYMSAVLTHRPPGGVVLTDPGYMFGRAGIPQEVLIRKVGDVEVPDLASFARELSKYGDQTKVSMSFNGMVDKQRKQVKACTVDRRWFPWKKFQKVVRNGVYEWDGSDWADSEDPPSKHFEAELEPREVELMDNEDPRLVVVNFVAPFRTDEISGGSYVGGGVILDAAEGLVVCDRNTVPASLGNCTVTIAGSVELPAEVLLVHPLHNFSFIKFDPSLVLWNEVGDVELECSEPSPEELVSGSRTKFTGFTHQLTMLSQHATVTLVEHQQSSTVVSDAFAGFFGGMFMGDFGQGAKNQVLIKLDNMSSNIGGILSDEQGRVQAFYFDFWGQLAGMPATVVFDTLKTFRASGFSRDDTLCTLAAELGTMHIAKATAAFGLTDEWVREFAANSKTRLVINVTNVLLGSQSEKLLSAGDILLAIDERPIVDYHSVELAAAAKDKVSVTLLRDLAEVTIDVPTSRLPYSGIARCLFFAGATLHGVTIGMKFRGNLPENAGVFIASISGGSPSSLYGLSEGIFITAINDDKCADLDEFLAIVNDVPDETFMRVHICTFDDERYVVTLKSDYKYWPTLDLKLNSAHQWAFAK